MVSKSKKTKYERAQPPTDAELRESLLRNLLRAYDGVIEQQQLAAIRQSDLRKKLHTFLTWGDGTSEVRSEEPGKSKLKEEVELSDG